MMNKEFKYIHSNEYPKKGEKNDVIILLHGYGGNAFDTYNNISSYLDNYFVVSLEATNDIPHSDGKAWSDIYFDDGVKKYNKNDVKISKHIIIDFIDYLKTKHKDFINDIYLLGFSQGSVMVQLIAASRPDLVKGVIGLSGFMLDDVISGDIEINVANIRELPMFIGHGTLDVQVPIEKDRRGKEFLESLGVMLEYKEYSIGHTISNEEMEDVNKWLNNIKLDD